MADGPTYQVYNTSEAGSDVPGLLRLYVCGQTSNSLRAIHNLTSLLREKFPGVYVFELIDVLREPALAEHERILATPTLVRVRPPPTRRIIGDLSDRERVMLCLELTPPSLCSNRIMARVRIKGSTNQHTMCRSYHCPSAHATAITISARCRLFPVP